MAGFDVDRLLSLRRLDALAVSPCGSWAAVAAARIGSEDDKLVHDLWRVDLDDALATPLQLTRGDTDDRAPCFRRDGALGFLSNRNPRDGKPEEGDDERAQVWILPAGGGEPAPLTDEPLGVSAFRFARDADLLVVVAPVLLEVAHERQRETARERQKHGPSALHYRRMPVRFWDHWLPQAVPHLIAYAEGRERQDLTPRADREHLEAEWDVDPAGTRAVITRATPGADRLDDRALALIDVNSGEPRTLLAAPGTRLFQPLFSPDGTRIACSRHDRTPQEWGRPYLCVIDAASGEGRALAADWDVHAWPQAWTPAGDGVLVTADYRAQVPVFRVDAQDGKGERITALDAGGSHEQIRLIPERGRIAGLRHRLLHPPEVFRGDLETDARPELLARLSGFGEEQGAALARVESIEAPGDGGVPVHAYLVHPASRAETDAALPGLTWIHGGPAGHWGDGWHWRWNPLVPACAGYTVILPNPRGSTGFGESFVKGAWGNSWGAAPYRDVMAVVDAAAARPDVDASRMVAMGGSFGGYMTNWIGAHSERFRCLVTHASLYALSGFAGVTDQPAFWTIMMGGSPYEDRDDFDRYSPRTGIAAWKTPTLVIHGERDYRVPIGEALGLFEALQAHGVESELLVFPDENHFILKPRNIRVWYRTWLDFVARHVSAG